MKEGNRLNARKEYDNATDGGNYMVQHSGGLFVKRLEEKKEMEFLLHIP